MAGLTGTKPPRPAITTVFAGACAFWGACAITYTSARLLDVDGCITGSLAALVLGATLSGMLLYAHRAAVAIGVMALCFGLALGCATAGNYQAIAESIEEGPVEDAVMILDSDSKEGSRGECAFVTISFKEGPEVHAYAELFDDAPLLHGTRARVKGTWSAPD